MNSVRSSIFSLKYQSFTPSGCKDEGRRTFKSEAKTQFLSLKNVDIVLIKVRIETETHLKLHKTTYILEMFILWTLDIKHEQTINFIFDFFTF